MAAPWQGLSSKLAMQQQKPSQQPIAGKRTRSDDQASASKASNGNSSNAVGASQDGGHKAGNSGRGLPRKEVK